jgi:hypothetical protein
MNWIYVIICAVVIGFMDSYNNREENAIEGASTGAVGFLILQFRLRLLAHVPKVLLSM